MQLGPFSEQTFYFFRISWKFWKLLTGQYGELMITCHRHYALCLTAPGGGIIYCLKIQLGVDNGSML